MKNCCMFFFNCAVGTLRDIEALAPEHQDAALAAMFKLPEHIKAKVRVKWCMIE